MAHHYIVHNYLNRPRRRSKDALNSGMRSSIIEITKEHSAAVGYSPGWYYDNGVSLNGPYKLRSLAVEASRKTTVPLILGGAAARKPVPVVPRPIHDANELIPLDRWRVAVRFHHPAVGKGSKIITLKARGPHDAENKARAYYEAKGCDIVNVIAEGTVKDAVAVEDYLANQLMFSAEVVLPSGGTQLVFTNAANAKEAKERLGAGYNGVKNVKQLNTAPVPQRKK